MTFLPVEVLIRLETSALKFSSTRVKKQVTMTLTLSVRLHSRCRVDSISKQTVSGHLQTDHTGTDGTCKTQAKYSHVSQRKRKTILSGLRGAPVIIAQPAR